MRRAAVLFAPALVVGSLSGLLMSPSGSAGASPSQTGGDDLTAWQPGWSWTYDTTFTSHSSSVDVTVTETETYTVASPAIVSKDGYSDTYQVNISGSISSCSGSADGYSISNCSGSASGTAWYEAGDLGLVEEDQSQHVNGDVESIIGFSATFNIDLTPSPGLVLTDFRLHNGDTWLIDTTVSESGNYSYSSSVASGGGPISGTQPIDTTASVATGTVSEPISGSIAVDEVTANDSSNGVSIAAYWAPRYDNLAYLNLNMSGAQADLTQSLASASTPTPATTISESLSPALTCAGGPVTVTGALSNGLPSQSVTIATDEEPSSPGDLPSTTTTTGSGGGYSATITAPTTSDGLDKPGARGAWGILVTSGSARSTATLEVTPQDCTTMAYVGQTSGPQGGTATVSAQLTDVATGQGVGGASVTFSLSGQSATATATTAGNGVASTTLPLAGPPRSATITATFAGSSTENAATATANFTVTTDPTATAVTPSEPTATYGDDVTFTAQVSEAGASVAAAPTGTVTFFVDGTQLGSPVPLSPSGSATSSGDSTMSVGTHQVEAVYSGDTNYASSSDTISFLVHPPLTPTSTELQVSPTSTVYGQAVSLTATVTAGSGYPDGSVEFLNGSTDLGTVMLPASNPDQVTLSVTNLPVGQDSITADYLGDNYTTYDPSSSSPVSVTVTQDSTTLGISPATTAPVTGQSLTYSISVSANAPGSGMPTGTVTLSVDGAAEATATLVGGAASVSVPGVDAGSHTIGVDYSGDTNFKASTATISQTVGQAQTTTAVTSSENPSTSGQVVTFTATVTANAPGSGDPTGTVTFFDNGTSIGAGALSVQAGQDEASISLDTLPVGNGQLITATYGGDANYLPSTSSSADSVVQDVAPAPPSYDTVTTLSSSQDPSTYGQPVTFTATVTSQGGGTPDGTVQFSVDGANLGGPVTLVNGQAVSPAVADLAAGGHTVIAAYSGDLTSTTAQYNPSGQVLSQTVQQAQTQATVTSSENPATYGQPLTFSATLAAVPPGAGTPGGTVQFLLDGQDIGNPVPVSNGSASVPYSTVLNPGSYTLSVITSGDTNFTGTTASVTLVVSHVPVVQHLTIDADSPDYYGNSVIIDDTVTPSFGPGTPVTGVVQFYAGSMLLGQADLVSTANGQRAGFGLSTLNAGTYSITAVYEGNAFYAEGTSPAVSFTVEKAPTKLTASKAALSGETLTATLTNTGNFGSPVADQPVMFVAGSTVMCAAALTNASGVATCSDSKYLLQVIAAGGYTVIYSGNDNYLGYALQEGLV